MDHSNLIDYSHLTLLISIGIKYSNFEFSSKFNEKSQMIVTNLLKKIKNFDTHKTLDCLSTYNGFHEILWQGT